MRNKALTIGEYAKMTNKEKEEFENYKIRLLLRYSTGKMELFKAYHGKSCPNYFEFATIDTSENKRIFIYKDELAKMNVNQENATVVVDYMRNKCLLFPQKKA